MGREGADTMGGPYTARRLEVEGAVMRAGWRLELPYSSRLCRSAGVTAGMASLAACSTRTSGVASLEAFSTRIAGVGSLAARSTLSSGGGHAGPPLHGSALG